MNYNDYINQLNNLDNQDIKAELENFYFFNSGLLQFFKAIDNQIKTILNNPNLNPKSVELIQSQVNEILPILNKLKFEISIFDSEKLSNEYKETINKTITYVKDFMVTGEVAIISNQLFDLLKENEISFLDRKDQKEKEKIQETHIISTDIVYPLNKFRCQFLRNGKYGICESDFYGVKKKIVVPAEYDEFDTFGFDEFTEKIYKNYFRVVLNGKFGVYDSSKDTFILDCIFDEIFILNSNISIPTLKMIKDDMFGYVSIYHNFKSECIYDNIKVFNEEVVEVIHKGKQVHLRLNTGEALSKLEVLRYKAKPFINRLK